MAKAKNQVVEGKHKGKCLILDMYGVVNIVVDFFNKVRLTDEIIENITLLNAEQSKDTGSAIARGLVGGILLGPAGLIGGALIGKTSNINIFQITYKNGEKSLLEVDKKISEKLFSLQWQIENK